MRANSCLCSDWRDKVVVLIWKTSCSTWKGEALNCTLSAWNQARRRFYDRKEDIWGIWFKPSRPRRLVPIRCRNLILSLCSTKIVSWLCSLTDSEALVNLEFWIKLLIKQKMQPLWIDERFFFTMSVWATATKAYASSNEMWLLLVWARLFNSCCAACILEIHSCFFSMASSSHLWSIFNELWKKWIAFRQISFSSWAFSRRMCLGTPLIRTRSLLSQLLFGEHASMY